MDEQPDFIQPSADTRWKIATLGFLIPMGLLMVCHVFTISLDPAVKEVLTYLAFGFAFMSLFENGVMAWNMFKPTAYMIREDFTPLMNMLEIEMPKPVINRGGDFTNINRNKHGYVYLLNGVHDPKLFKIGRTNNPDNRLRTFNVKLPFPVEYVCVIKTTDMYATERRLHGKFAAKRINGEWFELDAAEVGYIKALADASKTSAISPYPPPKTA